MDRHAVTLPAFLAGAALGIALYRVAGPEAPFWAGFVILVIVVAREIDDAARDAAYRRRVLERWERWEAEDRGRRRSDVTGGDSE